MNRILKIAVCLAGAATMPVFAPAQNAAAQTCEPKSFPGAWKGEVTLCQNWDANEQDKFWFLPQGSLMIPYQWFLALEQKGSTALFRDNANMNRFRYLPQKPTALRNPDGLPIGFTKDSPRSIKPYSDISDQWLGMTCAACHTGQIEFGGRRILVDGAPAMADFETFTEELVDALQTTLSDTAKFDRFAARVLNQRPEDISRRQKSRLKADLKRITEMRAAYNARNTGPHRYGYARLDAIGAILNQLTHAAYPDSPAPDGAYPPADAPVSFPYLWDTPHYDRVQWNGSVKNKGLGALGRNVGEVLGVFGGLEYRRFLGNRSSANIENLGELEELIATLTPPKWPETLLPPINRDPAVQNAGKATFDKYCVSCHKPITAGMKPPFKAFMISAKKAGTDPAMAENFANRMSPTGILSGRLERYLRLLSNGQRFEDVDFSRSKLGYGVIGTLVRRLVFDLPTTIRAIKAGKDSHVDEPVADMEKRLTEDQDSAGRPTGDAIRSFLKVTAHETVTGCDAPEPCYKSRSLRGIWATAPYLHNGSVRNMRQLLLPADQREKTFRVGSRTYDPENIGFVNEGGYLFDTSLPGNSNKGHEYGVNALSGNPELVDALLEYLKTL